MAVSTCSRVFTWLSEMDTIHTITHAHSTSKSRYLVLQVSLDTTGNTAMTESQSERVQERTRCTCKQALWRNICLAFRHKTQDVRELCVLDFCCVQCVKLVLLFFFKSTQRHSKGFSLLKKRGQNHRSQINPFFMPTGTASVHSHSTESLNEILP